MSGGTIRGCCYWNYCGASALLFYGSACWFTIEEAIELAIEFKLLSKLTISWCEFPPAGGGVVELQSCG